MGCLDNIIKLSRTVCTCFDTDKPLDYNEGQSEFYLDELQGIQLESLQASENCEAGNLWDMMNLARKNAALQFKADLLAGIQTSFINRRANFSGVIGNTAFNSTLNLLDAFAGVVFKPIQIVGGYFELNRIGLMFNTTSPITINVYSNEDITTPIATYNMNTTMNVLQFISLVTPLKLPLWSDSVDSIEYYIVYDLNGSYLPKNNKIDCGCNKSSNVTYKQWANLSGIKGSSLSAIQSTNELNGLVIDGTFKCESGRLICSDDYPLDFENDGRGMQIAVAVRFKAGEILVQKILDSSEINHFTLMNREALYGKRNSYRASYEKWIEYLIENTEVINTDCLMCKPSNNFQMGNIFA